MKISASSFETAKDQCMRKWAMAELWDMPSAKEPAGTGFGGALHGVCERYLKADDRGNGPDLYPAGWNKDLDDADTALVKLLVQAAIDKGHLVRRKGRQPERYISRPILVDDDVVQLTGKLDVEDETGFEDHKSTKAKKWTKDAAGLASDAAMMFYAVDWCRRHGEAVQVRMRYNYFLKDPSRPETWPIEAYVARAVVEHFEQHELLPTVRAMVAVAKSGLTEEQWEQVEGPKTQDVCTAYGGCPFATICGRVEQPAQYRARVARILSNRPKPPMGIFSNKPSAPAPAPEKSAAEMAAPLLAAPPVVPPAPAPAAAPAAPHVKPVGGIFARRNSTPPAAPAAQAPAAPAAPEARKEQVQLAKPEKLAAAAEPVPGAAPWAHPGCKFCKGTGMHPTEKRPCKGCRSTRMVQKLPTDEAYDISYDAQGNLLWQEKGAAGQPDAQGSIPAFAPVTAPVAQPVVPTITEPVEKPKAAKPRKKTVEVAQDVVPPAPPAETLDAPLKPEVPQSRTETPILDRGADQLDQQMEAALMGLPLILLCGAAPEKLPAYYRATSMADVFAEAAQLVADATGKPFFEINAFERRDALAKMAERLAARLSAVAVICPRSTPDVDALVQALKPYAGIVLVGLN